MPKAESWIIEESEVDPINGTVRCTTKNLDHVKVMRVEEQVTLHRLDDGCVLPHSLYFPLLNFRLYCSKTLQKTQARFISNFGWGLTKRIESHSLAKFKANVQRVCFRVREVVSSAHASAAQSREGVSLVLGLIRQARMQPMHLGASYSSFLESYRSSSGWGAKSFEAAEASAPPSREDNASDNNDSWSWTHSQ